MIRARPRHPRSIDAFFAANIRGDDMRKLNRLLFTAVLIASFHIIAVADGENAAPDGWRAAAPRDEIRPRFDYRPKGGKDGKGAFLIIADDREGLDGYW